MTASEPPPSSRPRADLPRARHLVAPGWLAALRHGLAVRGAPGAQWCLLEVGNGPPGLFLQGHIPGAGYLDTHWLERPPLWNALALPALQALLLRLGIGPDTTVVLYGRHTAAAGRAAHLLLVAGVCDVRLLDGGFAAWLRAGLACEAGDPHQRPPRTHGTAVFTSQPHYLVHTPQVRQLLRNGNARLVSIRTWDEFVGRTSGYSYIAARGEIPGALWGRAGDDGDMNSVSAFQNPDGTMQPAHALSAIWRGAGFGPKHRTVFYCGTGWRASVAFFYAWLMGWEQISVYDGGWLAWSSDPANPTVVHGEDAPARVLSLPA